MVNPNFSRRRARTWRSFLIDLTDLLFIPSDELFLFLCHAFPFRDRLFLFWALWRSSKDSSAPRALLFPAFFHADIELASLHHPKLSWPLWLRTIRRIAAHLQTIPRLRCNDCSSASDIVEGAAAAAAPSTPSPAPPHRSSLKACARSSSS